MLHCVIYQKYSNNIPRHFSLTLVSLTNTTHNWNKLRHTSNACYIALYILFIYFLDATLQKDLTLQPLCENGNTLMPISRHALKQPILFHNPHFFWLLPNTPMHNYIHNPLHSCIKGPHLILLAHSQCSTAYIFQQAYTQLTSASNFKIVILSCLYICAYNN